MENQNTGNILGTEKVGHLLVKFAVPGIISMVVNALYNIVDQVFIGQGVGYLGNGATNAVFPLTTFLIACAMLLGDGAASYISLMLGKKKDDEAARGAAAGIVGTIIVGILLAALYLIFLKPLCALFGATDKIMTYAIDYGTIISIGIPFSALCCGLSGIIRADGSPRFNMAGLLLGCGLNLVLDPLFIFVFHWGVKGAAWATIIGQIANATLNIWYVTNRMKSVNVTGETYRHCLPYIARVARLGISSFINQFAVVIIMAVQNNCLVIYGARSAYGAEIPMTALGVTMKVFNIMLSVIIGLTGGAQPILGFNYGSRRYDRVKHTFRLVMIIAVAAMSLATLAFQLVPGPIVSIFGTGDELYTDFSVKCLRIFLMLMPLGGVQMTIASFFQALGRPVQSGTVSLSKQILFQLPFTLILCAAVGVEGALWAGPASDILAFLLAVILLAISWKKLFSEKSSAGSAMKKDIADYSVAPAEDAFAGKPLIVTIGRVYGAGGRPVGKLLAKRLGIPYYDSEILVQTAHKIGVDAAYLESVDEKSAMKLMLYSAAPSRGFAPADLTALSGIAERAQQDVIESVAAKGSCVIVGRRADQILKNKANLLRVFITLPEEDRVNLVSARDGLTREEALKNVRRIDRERADYYNAGSGTKWGAAESYDLCLDLKRIGTGGAVNLLEDCIRRSGAVITH